MWDYEYLYDNDFLAKLDAEQNQTIYVKLTVLTLQNIPIGAIEGKATGGSISVNGSSAIRRTGSLNMIADESNYRITELKNIIYMNKKVQVEVGYTNQPIDSPYKEKYDIIWFPLGVFVMSNANIQKNNQGITISLTLKDQMSLLNGENGGTFETEIQHSPIGVEEIDEVSGNSISEQPVLYYSLIYELLTKWGKIPENYIIIEDVPLTIENIVRWTNSTNVNITEDENTIQMTIITDGYYGKGDSIGYQEIDYVYPEDLVSTARESIVSVLEKIKQALGGNYEYFFDTKGFFHFQKNKEYILQGVGMKDLEDALSLKYTLTNATKSIYDFSSSALITSYQNAPQWENVKNDFIVQGKNSTGSIRYHLIIDDKPQQINGDKYYQRYNDAYGITRWVAVSQDEYIAPDWGSNNENFKKKQQYAESICREQKWEYTQPALFEKGSLNHSWADWRIMAYFYSIENPNLYFYSKELIEEIPKIYDFSKDPTPDGDYYSFPFREGVTPNTAEFWIDIIDNSNIDKFKVSHIGKRTKPIIDDQVNRLFTPYFPNICFIEANTSNTAALRKKYKALGKSFYQLNKDSFANIELDGTINSAYELLRSQIHTVLSFNESVSIGIVPIYHLEPNTRITIEDEDTNIHGDYIIKSFTLPLAANGQMTLSCLKAIEMI